LTSKQWLENWRNIVDDHTLDEANSNTLLKYWSMLQMLRRRLLAWILTIESADA
jgi:hypothetical protein